MTYSIRALLLVVLYVSLRLASAYNFNSVVHAFTEIFWQLMLLTATVGSIYQREDRRAFFVGFAIFGWVFWLPEATIDFWRAAPISNLVYSAMKATGGTGAQFWKLHGCVNEIVLFGLAIGGGQISRTMYLHNRTPDETTDTSAEPTTPS